MSQRLHDKVAVITGGTSGIGEATASLFVAEGAQVVICGRSEEKGQRLASTLGDRCRFITADVLIEADIERTLNFAVETFGGLDILFNTAGGQNHGRVDTIGMRFGPFAYSTDCVDLSPDILGQLRDWQLKLWMADAARIKPHPAHAHLDMALDWMRQVQPERGLLTHMSEFLDYKTTRAACPAFVGPAYDGMELLSET